MEEEEEEEEEVNKPSDMEFEISKINDSLYTNINLNSKLNTMALQL